ncbi:MAG TPA: carboxyl transferase domain-containing protein [Oscillospiraceae bacterium]|nr:carboxyl transferase domain-containing protein [Oscillospiraceae bacterium]
MSNVGNAELLQTSRDAVKKSNAYKRVNRLFDEDTFNEIDSFSKSGDHFAEVITGFGTVDGCPAYVFAQNAEIDGGAMSKAQASKIKKIVNLAVKTGTPVIGIYDSIGARLKEGADMLAAYGEILLSSNNLSGVVPQISLILGPCIGTSAMIAANADIVVMSDKSEFTIETSGSNGSADAAAKLGVCHIAAENEECAIAEVRRLITVLPSNNLAGAPITNLSAMNNAAPLTADSTARDILSAIADDDTFIELGNQFGTSAITGLAQMVGSTVGIVSYNGSLDADSCSKAARFIRFCDAFSLPVVTLADATEFTSLREASKLSNAYSEATTAKVTVITGSAYGSVYIAIAGRGANADITLAWPNAVVSPLSPATAAVFEWSDRLTGSSDPVADRQKLIEEYKQTETSPFIAAASGFIEDIIYPEETRAKIIANLDMLSGKRVTTLPKKHANIQL